MNVLFLTHRLPYAPNRGDRVRAWHLLRALRPHADVHVVSLVHDEEEASHAGDLAGMAASVRVVRVSRARNLVRSVLALPSTRPVTHTMLDGPDLMRAIAEVVASTPPDVVLAYCSGMARVNMAPPLDTLPFVLDMVDVDSAKWAALARLTAPPLSWIYTREARVLGRFEAVASTAASSTLVVTPRERDTLVSLAPHARIAVVPNGVDLETLRPPRPPADSETVVFCGVMNYAPNEQAAVLLAREVWPLVRQRHPRAQLQIVGAQPTAKVRALADNGQGIEVTGAVPDVRPYLWSAAAAAAPIVTARGIQNKVLEAVAAGLPTVVTPNIFEALPAQVRPACITATTPPQIAEALGALLSLPPPGRRDVARSADLSGLSWDEQLAGVIDLLREAVASGRRGAAA